MYSISGTNSTTTQRPHPRSFKPGGWRVIHACEYARDILPVVEAQIAAGMRPYIVTPQGEGAAELYLARPDLGSPATLSLLRAWQDVRNWRKSLLQCDPETASDLVHAHSFSSAMAGVRNLSCIVYDLGACIEEFAISAGLCESGSWMGRSFRVAEQFILSRAQAVIVHSLGMQAAAEERGVAPENVFLIPSPLPDHFDEVLLTQNHSLQPSHEVEEGTITFLALNGSADCDNHSGLAPNLVTLLEAYALARAEDPESRLLIESSPAVFSEIAKHAEKLGIGEHVFVVEPGQGAAAMKDSTIVIVGGETPDDPVQARLANESALRALVLGRPLLAADVPRNRDCSPVGAGCLWFYPGDARDLGARMAFLGCNRDFRRTLAASGRNHILRTRSSNAIGQLYDAAYRHAVSRKKTTSPGQPTTNLQPLISGSY